MAKSGGKDADKGSGKRGTDEKRKKHGPPEKKDKSGKKDKDKKGKKAVRAAKSAAAFEGQAGRAGATKLKAVKLNRAEDTQRLVEEVAARIVIAELDRASDAPSATERMPAVPPQSIESVKAAAEEGRKDKKDQDGKKAKAAAASQVDPGDGAREAEDRGAALSELLRAPSAPVDLAAIDPGSTPGVSSREQAEEELPKLAEHLAQLQERLFAAARGGDSTRRVLLVLQGMDTSGKGGTVRHVIGQLDPNGVRLAAFKAPTEEERSHDFLWRIRKALPVAGEVGIFDRSHYEDVLIARVHKLAPPAAVGRRYQMINRFEQALVADGVVLVKCFLHISRDEQRRRLLARLDDPTKLWKYNPGDVDERALWPQYQDAYRIALEKCSTREAPWYMVPADHKWYRNYAIMRLLIEALERIDPAYPPGEFDVEVERKRVLAG